MEREEFVVGKTELKMMLILLLLKYLADGYKEILGPEWSG